MVSLSESVDVPQTIFASADIIRQLPAAAKKFPSGRQELEGHDEGYWLMTPWPSKVVPLSGGKTCFSAQRDVRQDPEVLDEYIETNAQRSPVLFSQCG